MFTILLLKYRRCHFYLKPVIFVMVNSLLYINTGIQKYLYRWKYHYDISKYLVIVTGLKGNIKAS